MFCDVISCLVKVLLVINMWLVSLYSLIKYSKCFFSVPCYWSCWSLTCDKTKNIFLYFFIELKTYSYSLLFYLQDMILLKLLILAVCWTHFILELCNGLGAWNLKVWGSIPHGDSEFFFVPCLWQDKKTSLFKLSFVGWCPLLTSACIPFFYL